jgi:predicted PurR-regulated permease PerM
MIQAEGDHNGFLRRLALTLLFVALTFLAWKAQHVLLLTFFGILLAVLLTTLTKWTTTALRPGWRWALGLVLMVLIALLVGAGWLIGPRLAQQSGQFSQQLNQAVTSFEQRLSSSEWGARYSAVCRS